MDNYRLEICSAYKIRNVCDKKIIIFDDHNMALPVWGTCAADLHAPLNLITFDQHTDTHPFLNRYMCSSKSLFVPYDKSVFDIYEVKTLLDGYHYKREEFDFNDVFRIANMISNAEQILTGYLFGYLCSYTIVHRSTSYDDTSYGYKAKYIESSYFTEGNRPSIPEPLILDVDMDYFTNQKEIINWGVLAAPYIHNSFVITIAREPKYYNIDPHDCSIDEAERLILRVIEDALDLNSI